MGLNVDLAQKAIDFPLVCCYYIHIKDTFYLFVLLQARLLQ